MQNLVQPTIFVMPSGLSSASDLTVEFRLKSERLSLTLELWTFILFYFYFSSTFTMLKVLFTP